MHPKRKYRVVVDTNLWISLLLSSHKSVYNQLLNPSEVQLIFSTELLNEFTSVARRPKFRKYFDEIMLNSLVTELLKTADIVNVQTQVNYCRDKKDNFILSLCVDGNASHLITGDKDLLVLKKIGNTQILTMTDFFTL